MEIFQDLLLTAAISLIFAFFLAKLISLASAADLDHDLAEEVIYTVDQAVLRSSQGFEYSQQCVNRRSDELPLMKGAGTEPTLYGHDDLICSEIFTPSVKDCGEKQMVDVESDLEFLKEEDLGEGRSLRLAERYEEAKRHDDDLKEGNEEQKFEKDGEFAGELVKEVLKTNDDGAERSEKAKEHDLGLKQQKEDKKSESTDESSGQLVKEVKKLNENGEEMSEKVKEHDLNLKQGKENEKSESYDELSGESVKEVAKLNEDGVERPEEANVSDLNLKQGEEDWQSKSDGELIGDLVKEVIQSENDGHDVNFSGSIGDFGKEVVENEKEGEEKKDILFDWEGIERSELEKRFGAMDSLSGAVLSKVGSDVQMQLYGLHKVATEGPCYEPQPSLLKLSARTKWHAWHRLGNMNPEEAMEQYINLISDIIPGCVGENPGDKKGEEASNYLEPPASGLEASDLSPYPYHLMGSEYERKLEEVRPCNPKADAIGGPESLEQGHLVSCSPQQQGNYYSGNRTDLSANESKWFGDLRHECGCILHC